MPSALLRCCPSPGCPELTTGGPCATHARVREQRRGSAASRGYGPKWKAFRLRFSGLLIAAGVAPACGASLPGLGPNTNAFSQCAAEGRLETNRLHLDHEPPLTDEERADVRTVCDIRRVGFLCERCHTAKTNRERRVA